MIFVYGLTFKSEFVSFNLLSFVYMPSVHVVSKSFHLDRFSTLDGALNHVIWNLGLIEMELFGGQHESTYLKTGLSIVKTPFIIIDLGYFGKSKHQMCTKGYIQIFWKKFWVLMLGTQFWVPMLGPVCIITYNFFVPVITSS